MNKKTFIVVLSVFVLLTLNFTVAHELDNVTGEVSVSISDVDDISHESDALLIQSSQTSIKTNIEVESETVFDVVGDSFKIKLCDEKDGSVSNAKVTFTLNGATYTKSTDSKGIASLPLNIKDGTYKIVTKFAGNSKYQSSSKTTTIVMNNTRIVDKGLTNSEIQQIIDNAKEKNIILFKGSTYSDINIVINKRLTLLSNVGTTLKSSSGSPVISIKGKSASSTTVKGFNIEGKGNGIVIDGSNYVTIINNEISTKSNGIVANNVNYLNVTKNNLLGNSKNGIVLTLANNSHISKNKINNNGENGIVLAKTNKVYIYSNTISSNAKNGIYTTSKVNGINYGEGPKNLHISKNTINRNKNNGIFVYNAKDNININMNTIQHNSECGISITSIGDNVIQSNEISDSVVGIKFNDEYLKPKNQEISYNVIHHNSHLAVEAKDTYYYDHGEQLKIGDNWYTDDKLVCPKISSNNLKFVVTQIGKNSFQATFYDSKGNIASLLPDRELTYQTNDGQIFTVTLSGGTGIFTVDASNGDIVKATVDDSHRNNAYDGDVQTKSNPTNGVTPTYYYPDIEYDQLYDEGAGDGSGNGQGAGGNSNGGGNTPAQSSDNTGNSTQSQSAEPGKSSANQVNDVSQSSAVADVSSQVGVSQSGSASSEPSSRSVVKQIVMDEDEFVKITGISFIILLIIFGIYLYYRDDIQEMKSKL